MDITYVFLNKDIKEETYVEILRAWEYNLSLSCFKTK